MHWGAVNRRLKPWKDEVSAQWAIVGDEKPAVVAGLRGLLCEVRVSLPFDRTEKQWASDRRDPHNYVSTVVKAIVDQLTDKRAHGDRPAEQRLFPDDTPEFVIVIEPELVRGSVVTVLVSAHA